MTELSYDKLKNSSIEEIYESLKEEYINIFKSYNYAFITFNDYLIVIKNILINIISGLLNNPNINYKNYILKQSKIRLNNYIKNKIENDNISIINAYITNNININDNELKELKKLIQWFQIIDYIPDPSIIIDLVTNNPKLKEILANIVAKNLNKIQSLGLETVFTDELTFEFLDVYCNVYNIDVNSELNIVDDFTFNNENWRSTYLGADAIIKELKGQKLYELSKEEERDLFIKFKAGDEEAYNKILYHNLRLVLNIANKYLNHGLEFADLIQEGNIGLLTAIAKYDVSKGFKFSTYATWWIRQSITRAIGNKGKDIRIPIYKMEKLNKFCRQVKELTTKLGYEPSYEEIAKYCHLSYETVKENFVLLQNPTSLNSKINDEEDTELGDFIASPKNSDLEDTIINENLVNEVEDLLVKAGLTEIERTILKYRYGLKYSEEKLLKEIGKIYGVSRERIRQKEAKAIIKLRKCSLTRKFAIYLDNPDKAEAQIEKLRWWHYQHPQSNIVYNIDVNNLNISDLKEKSINIPKKSKRKLKTIYQVIPYYSKEEINQVIAELNEKDKKIFYLRNGDDLEHPKTVEEVYDLNYLYGLVVGKIKRNLRKAKKIKTIYECLYKYSKEEINQGISMLNDKDKTILYYRYGNDLEHPITSNLWNPSQHSRYLYDTIFKRIERNIKLVSPKITDLPKKPRKKSSKTVYEQLSNYSKEEINAEIAKLNEEDKKIFYLRNGDDLENPKSVSEFSNTMKKRYYNIILLLKKHLAPEPLYIRGTIFYQLHRYNSKYTKEEVLNAISMLSPEEKEIITSRYGEDLNIRIDCKNRKYDYSKVRMVLNHILSILANPEENNVPKELREFYLRAIVLLKTPLFVNLLLNLSVKEAIVLAIIILSYLENREINLQDMANLLEIDIAYLKEIYYKMLVMFKENINEYLITNLNDFER